MSVRVPPSLTEQAIDMIKQAGSKGLRSDVIGEKLNCGHVPALLKPKCDDGTLVFCKVLNTTTNRELNEYRLSVNGGGEMVEISGSAPGRPAAKKDPVLARMRESGLRSDGVDMDAIHRKVKPAPAAASKPTPEVPVFAEAKVDGNAPRVRGAGSCPAPIEPGHPTVGERLNHAHAGDIDLDEPFDDGKHTIGPIERDKPVPTLTGELRQALSEMKRGDSRLITGYTRHNLGVAASRENVSAIIRPEGGGFRVWRTK